MELIIYIDIYLWICDLNAIIWILYIDIQEQSINDCKYF